jgi:hypothetical protein
MDNIRNKSDMVNYAIPFNFLCAIVTLLFILLKFNDLKNRKTVDSSESSVDTKKFHSQVTTQTIKFLQVERGNIDKLESVIRDIESKRL